MDPIGAQKGVRLPAHPRAGSPTSPPTNEERIQVEPAALVGVR